MGACDQLSIHLCLLVCSSCQNLTEFTKPETMGASAIPIIIFTAFWGVVGGILPWFVPKGPNRGVTQTVLVITACSCWLFWLCCYLMQMNPLIGPNQEPNTSNHEERMGHFNLKCGHFDLSIPYITCVDVVCLYFSVEFYLCVHQLQ